MTTETTDIETTTQNADSNIIRSEQNAPAGFDYNNAWRQAKAMAGTSIFGKATPEQLMNIMMTGHEMGFSPTASVRAIYMINGKAFLSADAMVASVLMSGHAIHFTLKELTNESCTYITRRKGSPIDAEYTFTLEDAKRAGLTGKGTWKDWTKNMLRARCASNLVRVAYPDALLGVYAHEEMEDFVDAKPSQASASDLDAEIMGAIDAEVSQ